jgi:putative mRNA 3-end processing factor
VYVHGAVAAFCDLYAAAGVEMLETQRVVEQARGAKLAGELVLAPPSAFRSPWMRRFAQPSVAFASGWMQLRGVKRRKGYDRGFIVSDHADWRELEATVRATKARTVVATHGYAEPLARYLAETGVDAHTPRWLPRESDVALDQVVFDAKARLDAQVGREGD